MKFLLNVIVLLISAKNIVQGTSQSVVYVSFINPSPIYDIDMLGGPSSISLINYTDDTPLYEISMEHSFNFLGKDFDRLYANANGAIHISKIPPCGCCYGSYDCDLNTSYLGVVAGILTDLNPYFSKTASISLHKNENTTAIKYHEVPTFKLHYYVSFTIAFLKDGSIDISYEKFDEISSANYTTGLRNFTDSQFFLSEEQKVSQDLWDTSVPGIYPPTTKLKNNDNFVACPISTTWGANPSKFYITDTEIDFQITLTTLSMSCVDIIEIRFHLTTKSVYVNPYTAPFGICTIISSPYTSPSRYQCSKNPSSTKTLSSQKYYIHLLSKNPSSGSFSYLENVAAIPIEITSTNKSYATECALNAPNAFGCSATEICLGTRETVNDCSSLECTPANGSAYDVLYRYKNCNEECFSDYDLDKDETCCRVDNLDCYGVCKGDAEPAWSNSGAGYVCCGGRIDCAGVCDGKSKVSSCNVCNGEKVCEDQVRFEYNSSWPNHKYVRYDAANVSYVDEFTITISNDNETDVYFYFDMVPICPDSKCVEPYPTFFYPNFTDADSNYTLSYTLSPYSNVSFVIQSDIKKIVNGDAAWAVKTLHVWYIRPSQFSEYLDYSIDLLPESFNCREVSNRGMCIDLPGCIHCEVYDGLRILKEENDMEENYVVDEDTTQQSIDSRAIAYEQHRSKKLVLSDGLRSGHSAEKRSLYASIVPEIAGFYVNDPEFGVCRDGWDNSFCDTFPYDAALKNGYNIYVALPLFLIVLHLLV